MTGLGPSPLRLGAFAGDNPISFFALFAPFAVNYPIPNLRLRRSRARLFAVARLFLTEPKTLSTPRCAIENF
jgi:hypothetical protein